MADAYDGMFLDHDEIDPSGGCAPNCSNCDDVGCEWCPGAHPAGMDEEPPHEEPIEDEFEYVRVHEEAMNPWDYPEWF